MLALAAAGLATADATDAESLGEDVVVALDDNDDDEEYDKELFGRTRSKRRLLQSAALN